MNIVFSALVGIRELRTIVYELKDVYVFQSYFFKTKYRSYALALTLGKSDATVSG